MMNTNQLNYRDLIKKFSWYLSWLFTVYILCVNPIKISHAQESNNKTWQEFPLTLPSAPETASLISFYKNTDQEFFLDLASLSLAGDETLRYTLVSYSRSGAKTTNYEGIRCQTSEVKFFAFGRANGTWSLAQQPKWKIIPNYGVNQHHRVLLNEYFCQDKSVAGTLKDIQSRLTNKQVLNKYK
jgi:hypothetical protein